MFIQVITCLCHILNKNVNIATSLFYQYELYPRKDPHSRNSHGFPDGNGASNLLTFNSFNKLSNYLTYLAMNLNTDQFELTPMKIVVGVPDYYMEHYITYKKQSDSPTSASRTSPLIIPNTSPICTTSSPPSISVIITSGILSCCNFILIQNSVLFLI